MEATSVMEFYGGLRGYEVLLASLEAMLKFWEETRQRSNQ